MIYLIYLIFPRRGKLTDALSVLDALVSAELEVEATGRRDPVVEEGAVGHEVAQPDALATAVVDLHVLHHHAVHGGQEVVAVVQLQVAVLAGACKRAGDEGEFIIQSSSRTPCP